MSSSISLAPPGAGLPVPELWVARALFALNRWTNSRAKVTDIFLSERQTISALLCDTSDAVASRPILIKRIRGLEDSSRNWSIWMTLDHLRIVHDVFTKVIKSLVSGVVPTTPARTANVKPALDVSRNVVAEYERSCDALLATVAAIGDLKTKARYAHPWFGLLDAAGWHQLSATHLRIHRVQIQRILENHSAQS